MNMLILLFRIPPPKNGGPLMKGSQSVEESILSPLTRGMSEGQGDLTAQCNTITLMFLHFFTRL